MIEPLPELNPLPSTFHGSRMLADVTQKCYTGPHLRYVLGIGIPGAALVILGVPLGTIYACWKNRKRLQHPKVIGRLGFVYFGAPRSAARDESSRVASAGDVCWPQVSACACALSVACARADGHVRIL